MNILKKIILLSHVFLIGFLIAESRVMVVADNIFEYLKDTAKTVEDQKKVHVLIRAGTSALALDLLDKNQTDIAAITRELTESEKKQYPKWQETPIASDALVFIVHPSNPVKNLSFQDVHAIYTNSNATWGDFIDGKSAFSKEKILPMCKMPENGSFQSFINYFKLQQYQQKGGSLYFGDSEKSKSAVRVATVGTDQAAISQLAVRKNAIAFVSLTALKSYQEGKDYRVVAYAGVLPSVKTTFDRSYPLTYRLNFVVNSERMNPDMQAYIDWILDGEGQDVFRNFGLAPINLKTKIIQTTSSITRFRQY